MAIYTPGYRWSNPRFKKHSDKRNVVAILSLTAMVDMFTVLTVFLLQNYNPDTGAVLDIPQDVVLPQASQHKELKPSHVVVVLGKDILFEKKVTENIDVINNNEELLLPNLYAQVKASIAQKKIEQENTIRAKLQNALDAAKSRETAIDDQYRKVTIQADKSVEFRVIKKIMHTLNEAGASEVNFAILQKEPAATTN